MSDEKDWQTYSRRSALGLMAVGGAVGVSETLGFSSVRTDRSLVAETPTDGNAMVDVNLPDTVDEDSVTENAIGITNNLTESVDITIEEINSSLLPYTPIEETVNDESHFDIKTDSVDSDTEADIRIISENQSHKIEFQHTVEIQEAEEDPVNT